MQCYLDNRYQRTLAKDKNLNQLFSSWEIIKHGVPQGSVLYYFSFILTLSIHAEYIYSAASQATSPDGVNILRDIHKVVK
jgi:hypothetical protein